MHFLLMGDYKSPGLIGRTFFYGGLQIRRDAWRETLWDAWRGSNPPGRLAGDFMERLTGVKSAGTPGGRLYGTPNGGQIRRDAWRG